jgi:hypothetical protein
LTLFNGGFILKHHLWSVIMNHHQEIDFSGNLKKTLQIVDSIFKLKLALYKKLHPKRDENELINLIHLEIIERKNQLWKSQTT